MSFEQLNTKLIPEAQTDLAYLQEATGLNTADVINRAIQIYAMAEREKAMGNDLALWNQEAHKASLLRIT